MTQIFKTLWFALALCLLLSGCVYKIDVQQGNVITNKELQSIKPGMSVADVQKQLGEPVLRNVYKNGTLLYVYTMKKGHHDMTHRSLIVYFENAKVTKVEKDTSDK